MKVRWIVPAAEQLEQIYEYNADGNPGAAEEVAQRVIDITEMLGKHPGAGRGGRVPGTREFSVPDSPLIVAYSVSNEIVSWRCITVHGGGRNDFRLDLHGCLMGFHIVSFRDDIAGDYAFAEFTPSLDFAVEGFVAIVASRSD